MNIALAKLCVSVLVHAYKIELERMPREHIYTPTYYTHLHKRTKPHAVHTPTHRTQPHTSSHVHMSACLNVIHNATPTHTKIEQYDYVTLTI